MKNLNDYEKANPHIYQGLVEKLIHLLCNIRSDIAFLIEQFHRLNANLKKSNF